MMNILFNRVLESNKVKQIIHAITNDRVPVIMTGIPENGRSYIIAALMEASNKRNCMVITHNEVRAKQLYEDLSMLYNDKAVFLFPNIETFFYDVNAKSNEIANLRLEILNRLVLEHQMIVIASVDALLSRLIPKEIFSVNLHTLTVGQKIEISDILEKLYLAGYENVEKVEAKGQFSVRGDIIDFCPMVGDYAYRIEFFDDEIDSIRTFDMATQRSVDKVGYAMITPAKEFIYNKTFAQKAAVQIRKEFNVIQISKDFDNPIKEHVALLEDGLYFQGVEKYLPFFYNEYVSLVDYLPKDSLICYEDISRIEQRANNAISEFQQMFKSLLVKGKVVSSQAYLLNDFDTIWQKLQGYSVIGFEFFIQNRRRAGKHFIINIESKSVPSFQSNIMLLVDELKRWKQIGYGVLIVVSSERRGLRLQDALQENGIEAWFIHRKDIELQVGQICIINSAWHYGMEWPDFKFVLLTDREIYGIQKHRSVIQLKKAQSVNIFSELHVGDYVVHESYGIGQYLGIKKLTVDGKTKDYLFIRYADGGNLYVPTDRMALIQRYIGGEGVKPKLSKLGSSEWIKTKTRVKQSIKDMAKELLKLYATRYTSKGYVFSPDTIWQHQFEETFPYEETPDQLQAIKEIKADMESEKVMDRLLCGDVGYGKTEVALRAAFKAVMDGKQVAFLVPTTVLAQQHYNTCIKRFKDFPVSIDMISRFRNYKEQQDIVRRIKNGEIDIIIGTHRLLGKDIKFKDLGLLIIDEEQRFGVKHKEAIKKLKNNVDVLTMTATPIPRTLHMSLSNIRDMSIIETPPEERYPVQTYVVEYDEGIVRDAILREIGRNGQVYFVYNHVNSIDTMAVILQELVPEAKIAIAHGQMPEDELENVMINFMDGIYDVLLCTTIIETGLDIPNVNTLLVYDADRFGLAQLYQLRGRVGRSNRLAYAYFTYRKDKILQEQAEKRLQAITEFTELGSGLKIALKDLEIRGAGNLLGAEQHGHIAAVGYELYCKLLREAILQLKGESNEEILDTTVEIKVDAYIPDTYIPAESQRIEIYKRIISISSIEEEYDVEEEIEDRFGDIPLCVRNLLSIMHIKLLARQLNIISIEQKNDIVEFVFKDNSKLKLEQFLKIVDSYKNRLKISAAAQLAFSLKINTDSSENILNDIQEFLEKTLDLQAMAC